MLVTLTLTVLALLVVIQLIIVVLIVESGENVVVVVLLVLIVLSIIIIVAPSSLYSSLISFVAGGGILEVKVASILRVDGTLRANSLDRNLALAMNGASGGSGGSILIHTGAFIGKGQTLNQQHICSQRMPI